VTTHRRILFAGSVSWLGRVVTIVLGLILIPILFRHMGEEELGLWFMLGQSGAFLSLMDLGVSPTLTRRIAFAKGRSGGDAGVAMSEESRGAIAQLVATGRVIYRFLSAGVFLIAWTTGLLFLGHIELQQIDRQTLWTAWTIMCLSQALGVWAALWSCLLKGTGHVGWDGLIGIGIQVGILVTQILAVLLGGGLITLAVIAAIGAILSRLSVLAFIRYRHPELFRIKGEPSWAVVKEMARPALKWWATGLGAFLILKTDQYFIAYFQGAADIPSYQAAYQLVSNLMILAMALAIASQVFVSQLWQAGHIDEVHRLLVRSLRFGLIIMATGIACLLSVGENLIDLWLGPGHFIGYPVLVIFCAMLFLETQHSAIASLSRATEDEAFVFWALTAGVLNLALTWWLIQSFGLVGVALGTFFAQMLTNNWYAVYRGLWRLRFPLSQYLRKILLPVALTFILALLSSMAGKEILSAQASNLTFLGVGILTTGLVCAAMLWMLVLDETERRKLILKLSGTVRRAS
jgi:O-antigen/teichoic acid export membrane protein